MDANKREPFITGAEAFTIAIIMLAFTLVAWHGINKGHAEKIARMEMQVILKQLEQGCTLAPIVEEKPQ